MKRSRLAKFLAAGLILFAPGPGRGDETITKDPVLPNGSTANAPISNEQGVENWTSGGAGCCVVASQYANCNYLGLGEIGATLKRLSQREVGGHDPDKLERLFRDAQREHPDLKWIQFWNTPDCWEQAKDWSGKGYPIGVTWGTGKRYGYLPIAHMVSATHISDDWVQVKDNNFPEEYSTVPGPEGRKRIQRGGLEWYVVLLPPIPPGSGLAVAAFAIVGVILFFYGCLILVSLLAYRRFRCLDA